MNFSTLLLQLWERLLRKELLVLNCLILVRLPRTTSSNRKRAIAHTCNDTDSATSINREEAATENETVEEYTPAVKKSRNVSPKQQQINETVELLQTEKELVNEISGVKAEIGRFTNTIQETNKCFLAYIKK